MPSKIIKIFVAYNYIITHNVVASLSCLTEFLPYITFFNKTKVMYGVTDCELAEYSIHALTNILNQENVNELVVVTRSRNGKKR